MWSYLSVLLLLFIVVEATANSTATANSFPQGVQVRPISVGDVYNCCPGDPLYDRDTPVIYCFIKMSKGIFKIWLDVYVETGLNPADYELYVGEDSKEVWDQFTAQQSSWIDIRWQSNIIKLNPFNSSCFGILTYKNYTLKVHVQDIKLEFFLMYYLAVILFYFSHELSENKMFYYVSVFVFGMCASVLVVLYLIMKLVPFQRTITMSFLAGWATVYGIIIQAACKNFFLIFYNYKMYAISYISFSGLLSIVLYYRFGPIENQRTKKIVKYGLQFVGFMILFNSTYIIEAFEVTFIGLFLFTNTPFYQWSCRFIIFLKYYGWKLLDLGIWIFYERCNVRPRRLLTELEYRKEAIYETEKALSQLREYCKSEEFPQNWQLEDPLLDYRFHNFRNGGSHISQREEDDHHTWALIGYELLREADQDED